MLPLMIASLLLLLHHCCLGYHIVVTAPVSTFGHWNEILHVSRELLSRNHFITFFIDETYDKYLSAFRQDGFNQSSYQIIYTPKEPIIDREAIENGSIIEIFKVLANKLFDESTVSFDIITTFLQNTQRNQVLDLKTKMNARLNHKYNDILSLKMNEKVDLCLIDMFGFFTIELCDLFNIPIIIKSVPAITYFMEYNNFWDTYLYQHASFLMMPPETVNATIMSYDQRWLNLLANTGFQIFMKFISYWKIKPGILELNKKLMRLNKSIDIDEFNDGFNSFWNKAAIISSLGAPFSSIIYTRPRIKEFGFLLYPPNELDESSHPQLVEWLNENDKPILLISMGSAVIIPRQTIQTLYNILVKHSINNNYRIIWALRQNISVNISNDKFQQSHFKIMRWIPQFQLLQHDKVKLFLTHSGANGVVEAIYSKTLMILNSFGGDQAFNAKRVEEIECGIRIKDSKSFNDLTDHIYTLLLDKQSATYHQNKLNLIHDILAEQGDVRNATDFIEYAAKYGIKHLLCTSGDQYGCNKKLIPWHQQTMIDVYLVIILLVAIIAIITRKCCCFCCNLCRKNVNKHKMD